MTTIFLIMIKTKIIFIIKFQVSFPLPFIINNTIGLINYIYQVIKNDNFILISPLRMVFY
jgi:hypothetical protein